MPKKDPQNPGPAPAKKRAGRIARKASGAPAEFIPADPLTPPPALPMAPAMASADCFDAGAVAERLGIWWQNSKDGAYHMPGPDGRWLELNPGNIRAALLADCLGRILCRLSHHRRAAGAGAAKPDHHQTGKRRRMAHLERNS